MMNPIKLPPDFVFPPNREELLRKLDSRDRLMRGFEVIVLGLMVAITLFSLLRLNQISTDNKKNIDDHRSQVEETITNNSKTNRAKLDVGLCIFSVSPTRRTPEYVKSCYDQIEKETGIKVQRFGDGI